LVLVGHGESDGVSFGNEALNAKNFVVLLSLTASKEILVILDSCHSGRFALQVDGLVSQARKPSFTGRVLSCQSDL
jgi:hypothetical protein